MEVVVLVTLVVVTVVCLIGIAILEHQQKEEISQLIQGFKGRNKELQLLISELQKENERWFM